MSAFDPFLPLADRRASALAEAMRALPSSGSLTVFDARIAPRDPADGAIGGYLCIGAPDHFFVQDDYIILQNGGGPLSAQRSGFVWVVFQ